jgi:hypothetical protein
MEGGAVGHNFERDTPRNHLCQVWTLHRCFLPNLAPFGQAVSEEKIFLTLAVSIYVRSSIKLLHFVPFHQQIWPPRAILVSDLLLFKKIFFSETAWQNGAKLGRKHLCKILYFGKFEKKGNYSKMGTQIYLTIAG